MVEAARVARFLSNIGQGVVVCDGEDPVDGGKCFVSPFAREEAELDVALLIYSMETVVLCCIAGRPCSSIVTFIERFCLKYC